MFEKMKSRLFRSDVSGLTNFGVLRELIGQELSDSSVRSQRNVQFVFQAVEKLNKKFGGNIEESSHKCFPDEYFTCPAKCKSCESRCSMQVEIKTKIIIHIYNILIISDEALWRPHSCREKMHLLSSV